MRQPGCKPGRRSADFETEGSDLTHGKGVRVLHPKPFSEEYTPLTGVVPALPLATFEICEDETQLLNESEVNAASAFGPVPSRTDRRGSQAAQVVTICGPSSK